MAMGRVGRAVGAFGLFLVLFAALWAHGIASAGAGTPAAASHVGDAPALTETATPACGLGWSVVPSPNVGGGSNNLTGVSGVTAGDVWAVGWYTGTGRMQTLTEHWDGSAWSVVPSPNPSSGNNTLNA